MQKNRFLVAILISIAFCACDKIPTISYKVHNNTSSSIRVIRAVEKEKYNEKRVDTIVVAAGETEGIAAKTDQITSYAFYKLDKIMEHSDTITYIKTLNVYKNDTIASHKYFLLKNNWTFEKQSKYWGSYTLTISDNDF